MRSLLKSFDYAFHGIAHCSLTSRNFRIHTVAAFYAVTLGFAAGFTGAEMAIIFVICAVVLAAEGINCSIETLCDRIIPEKDDAVKHIKDIAAGCVLICALAAAAIAVALFFRMDNLRTLWRFALDNPIWSAGLILFSIPSIIYIFRLKMN